MYNMYNSLFNISRVYFVRGNIRLNKQYSYYIYKSFRLRILYNKYIDYNYL